MYIPFASLLGLQAALEPLVLKQPAPETASLDGINFVDPRPGGGSLLDKDSGGLGEPLNVSNSPLFSEDRKVEKSEKNNVGYHFRPQLSMGPRRWRLRTLCKRSRIVGFFLMSVWFHLWSYPDTGPVGKNALELIWGHRKRPTWETVTVG